MKDFTEKNTSTHYKDKSITNDTLSYRDLAYGYIETYYTNVSFYQIRWKKGNLDPWCRMVIITNGNKIIRDWKRWWEPQTLTRLANQFAKDIFEGNA